MVLHQVQTYCTIWNVAVIGEMFELDIISSIFYMKLGLRELYWWVILLHTSKSFNKPHAAKKSNKTVALDSVFHLGWGWGGGGANLPTLTHYAWVSRLQTKDIDLMHQRQFLTPGSQIRTSHSKNKFHFISDLLCIIPLLFITIAKAF